MPSEHEIEVRVRYSETDAMGFLHHGNYASLFELGRTELFRAQGGNYRDMESRGHFLVVVRLDTRFHKPARYDDLLRIRTRVRRVGLAKLEHDYEVRREHELLAEASSTLACVDREGRVLRLIDVLPNLDPPE
jgi:acyl-CoA thioester hydrolase